MGFFFLYISAAGQMTAGPKVTAETQEQRSPTVCEGQTRL